jgi:hypothetical protein
MLLGGRCRFIGQRARKKPYVSPYASARKAEPRRRVSSISRTA